MGTYEDADVGTSNLNHHPSEEPGLGFSSPSDQALIDKFQNVGLHSHGGFHEGDHYADPSAITTPIFPLRPYAGDCTHYLKTGVCKFGPNCKFNHPVKRTGLSSQVVKDMDRASEKKRTHAESKYYSTAGGFKFSQFRSYSHSKEDSDNAAPVLNFLGLPIRVGEKECPYYMRNGSCGYGAQCVFHHPEPSSAGEQDSHQSSLNDESLRHSGYYYGSLDRESALPNLAEASKPHQTPWSSHSPSNRTFSYHKDNSWHSTARPTPLEMPPNSELNQYQAPEFPHQRSTHGNLTHGASRGDMLQPINFGKVGEFPERPGQPECPYFIKTGYCKFKSACWFHHPKGQPACLLSENGLPLRPARSICRHYERFGTCKFGPACHYDHPINHNLSTVQDWSSSKPASGHDAGSWRK